jgi:hypothetical protein
MRITIEPTQNQDGLRVGEKHPVVVITLPYDDMNLPDVLECLITPALLAFGYRFMGILHSETDGTE